MGYRFKKYRNQEFLPLIKVLVELYEPEVYVEIGVQKGYTFNALYELNKIKRMIAVDPILQKTVANGPGIESYEVTSEMFFDVWKDPIDMLFIDGDHRAESVLNDFDRASTFLREGSGLILIHDTHPNAEYLCEDGYCSDAWMAAHTIHSSDKYEHWEIVTLPGPYAGLSIARKPRIRRFWR